MNSSPGLIELHFHQIEAQGYFISNLFRLGLHGKWRANLTNGVDCWEFGEGDTPLEALVAARIALLNGPVERRKMKEQTLAAEKPATSKNRNLSKISLADL